MQVVTIVPAASSTLREKANKLLFGEPDTKTKEEEKKSKEQKYSSQFNPQIARQNKLDPKKKYWLEVFKTTLVQLYHTIILQYTKSYYSKNCIYQKYSVFI